MLQGSVSTSVDAQPELIWKLLCDKVEQPELNFPIPSQILILQRADDYLVRERLIGNDSFVERVTIDNGARRIMYSLVNHPTFEGYISQQLLRSDSSGAAGCILAFAIDWRMKDGEQLDETPDMLELTNDDLFHIREKIEVLEAERRDYELLHPPPPQPKERRKRHKSGDESHEIEQEHEDEHAGELVSPEHVSDTDNQHSSDN